MAHAGPLSWWNWNLEMLVFVNEGKLENLVKNPQSKARTNHKLNPQMAPEWNLTWATLLGGEHSHYCPSQFLLIPCSQDSCTIPTHKTVEIKTTHRICHFSSAKRSPVVAKVILNCWICHLSMLKTKTGIFCWYYGSKKIVHCSNKMSLNSTCLMS